MSFIRDYLTYATGNECPEMFHVWGAYTCLSSAIGRKTWLEWEDEAKYPNLYVMLVGGAGNGKSKAMGKARRLLFELDDVHISGSVETPQGLIRFMGGNDKADPPVPAACRHPARWSDGVVRDTHTMTIIANEFINFISLMDREWINVLNDIYDSDHYHYRTKGGGEDSILGPYIVIFGALTTEVSNDLQKTRIISTGLARRTLFQFGERKWFDPHARPKFDDEQKAARARCIARLKQVQKLAGEFKWSDEVDQWWTAWYNPNLAAVPKKSSQTQSWFASKDSQVLKIAMLTSLSERDDLVLTVPHFELALAYLAELEKDLFKIFGGSGRNELAGISVKMVEYLSARNEPVFWKELYTNSWQMFDKKDPLGDFEKCLAHLVETNQAAVANALIGRSTVPLRIVATPPIMKAFLGQIASSPPPPPDATPTA